MDIDRNKINEMKSECLQMPDYIRDMIEETVEHRHSVLSLALR